MMRIEIPTDTYERKARLYPALLVVTPAVVTAAVLLGTTIASLQSLAAVVVALGGAYLLSHLARDAGLRGEKSLFESWGGMPSVSVFRHRDSRLDSITKARYQMRLATLVQGARAPTAAEERTDPAAADLIYTAWSKYIRANTRDTKKSSLLFKENVNYGFRRNVWGLRSLGILLCAVCCLINGARIYQQYKTNGVIDEDIVGAFALSVLFLVLWIFRFTAEWVRVPALAYADRLAESVETLQATTAKTEH